MAKKILIGLVIVLAGVAIFFKFSGDNDSKEITQDSEIVVDSSEIIEPNSSSEQKNDYKESEKEVEDMVMTFAQNWVKHDSIDERHNSVKEFLTEECIKKKGIDATVSADLASNGEIETVAKDVENDNRYLAFGSTSISGVRQFVYFTITLSEDEFKIADFTVDYVENGY
ncbi:hypothetical protein M2139_001488 [Enterococcus sp. PF1-24]|uniref:EF0163 family protein n=1 Tax=unclassified Enterococcus TaxID=2608891 RepID=UPI0024762481|nr:MULTISPECIES: EF0163 family protein [unclassified Enterococcus]MDH6364521.1 hypothetical protein [Enterococcus sp. PFB1-1]MDH6401602.1 hypothetical protein [Enterococcus sp. PF1-24]